jgi:hypothetical protein
MVKTTLWSILKYKNINTFLANKKRNLRFYTLTTKPFESTSQIFSLACSSVMPSFDIANAIKLAVPIAAFYSIFQIIESK